MKLNSTTSKDYSNMFEVENTTHAVPRFRGAHVSQSGAPKGDPHRFQCYNRDYRIFPVLENSTLHLWYFSIKEAPLKVFSNLILNIAIHPEK